ncbi:MAG: heme lyase CcmF/NrfE family subunit [Gammaproteobacteria bacterium]|nr:heme lyase CcmF/NrfE family subunit [Gammaproteobacteria bacterium]
MIPEIGHFALITALSVALLLGILPIAGTVLRIPAWVAVARPAAYALFLFVATAFGCLVYAFVQNDFSVLYVALHSNSALPIQYRVAAVWGGHEGSLLLWILMLSGWATAVALFSRHLSPAMAARVLGVMGLICVGFLLFILFTSNPFERLFPAAVDGRDLNPLLQDFGLVIHPPMLYMGYVGFSVAFAFAIAALIGGKLDAAWARWSRPWTTVAWVFLTIGIGLGSWWAYYELGWGGWWFWDPVENASFMPWLAGTALIHSLAVTEKRGGFRSWTVLLAILAFSLSLLGTFLVRSGVLTSVHAFATDPERGLFILIFLGVVIGGALLLYAWRAPRVGLGGGFNAFSRETMLLINNVLLVVALGVVLLGTLFPLVVDAFVALNIIEPAKISVGEPYFNSMFLLPMIPLLLLMSIGPYVRWKQGNAGELIKQLRTSFIISIVLAVALPFLMGEISLMVSVGLFLAAWLMLSILQGVGSRIAQEIKRGKSAITALLGLPNGYLGMQVAHFGLAVIVAGITLVKGYEVEQDVRMEVGDTLTMSGYTFRFDGVMSTTGPNYRANRGMIQVIKDGKDLMVLEPEKRIYNVQSMPMTEAAIDYGFTRDLYISLGDPLSGGAWSVRVYYKPFIGWLWGGCGFLAIGGFLAMSDRRYRIAARKQQARMASIADGRAVVDNNIATEASS